MSSALSLPLAMTADQFANWPGDGENRLHQLIDGEPVAMSPPSVRHGFIGGQLTRRLGNHFETMGSPCRVLIEPGVQPRAGASTNVRVPDLAVSCSSFEGSWLHDPILIVEILSPFNVRETREAVRAYLTIPSVREVLIIDSRAVRAELLRREPDWMWPAEPTVWADDDDIVLDSFGFRCALRPLYPP